MKTVVITGASTGIGKACALKLDQAGWRVFAGVRKQADADTLQRESSDRLTPVFIDVTNGRAIAAAVAVVEQAIGSAGLHGLVNNAGVGVGGPLEFIPIGELQKQLEINVIGQIAVTQAFLPLIRAATGRIINISSISGRIATPFVGPYAASKFALEALTDSLRRELSRWNIKVVSIQPGVIATPIWEKTAAYGQQMRQQLPANAETLYGPEINAMLTSLGKTGQRGVPPEQVAATVFRALISARPKTRYLIGSDAKVAAVLIKLLPDNWLDWLIIRFGNLI
jgi:NAD(P)-dependent dehydrogenase (short-subunit alcohol dehydrogenase family)